MWKNNVKNPSGKRFDGKYIIHIMKLPPLQIRCDAMNKFETVGIHLFPGTTMNVVI